MPARRAWLAAAVLLVQPLVMVGAHVAAADGSSANRSSGTSSDAGLSPEALASKQAAASGTSVAVASETTATDMVTALPDGTFRLDASPVPVRAKQGDTWVPVDTTLQVQPDGSVEPKATEVGTVFSGGGASAPLVTLSQGDASYSISAPWTLPAPTVSGATATYASVLPDVDLVVTAVPEGFTENVVVKTREAAADPRLSSLTFPVTTHGVTVKDQPSGGAAFVDAQGRPVFTTGSALAWDSAQGATSPQAARSSRTMTAKTVAGPSDVVDGPASGANTSVMDVDVSPTAMTVTPDQDFLSDPSTVYPVVLDPQTVSQSLASWTALWSGQPDTSFWKTSHSLGVGYDLPEDTKTVESLFQFDTHGVEGKKVLKATFTSEEIWANNCTPEPVQLWHTGGISSASTWRHHPTWMSEVDSVTTAKGWSSNCPGGNVEFDATSAVAYSAARDGATTTVGLRAADESDPAQWKQFASPSDTKPTLSVTFVSAPSLPTGLRLSDPSLDCGVNLAAAVRIHDVTPRMTATPKSADGSQATLRPNFEVHRYDPNVADPLVSSGSPSAWTTSGTPGNFTSSSLTNGQTYWFRARTQYQYTYNGTTGSMYSAWTPGCWFTIDTTAPPAPAISSTLYGECDSPDAPTTCPVSGAVGQDSSFKVTAGASDVVKYVYSLNGEKEKTLSTTSTAPSIDIAPDQQGQNNLTAHTIDSAGNVSASTSYYFLVGDPTPAIDSWSFDENTGTSAADSIGGHTATLASGASWSMQGRLNSALSVDGVNPGSGGTSGTSYASVTGTTLDTSKSFTISAWARLTGTTHNAVVAAKAGTNGSAFALYYSTGAGTWIFNRYTADVLSPTIVRSTATTQPAVGAWTHLMGVYDAPGQTIQLYVNGVPQGDPVSFTTPWNATGPLEIGRGQGNSGFQDYFPGQIDEVQLWNRVVSPDEAVDLQSMTSPDVPDESQPAEVADWNLNEGTGTSATDSSGYGRTGTLGSGATWTDDTDGGMGNVLSLDGSANSFVSVPGPLVDSQGDFTVSVWVKLDTDALSDTSVAHTMRIAGQSGTTRDSWALWYSQAAGQTEGSYVFGRTSADSTSATTTTAPEDVVEESVQDPGVWTMLTGVYDAARGQLQLYINGAQVGAVGDDPNGTDTGDGTDFTTPWQASGTFSIGRGRTSGGAYGDPTVGMVTKARVWTGMVSPSDIVQLWLNDFLGLD